mmetsp:Transcript_3917/g.7508  ORF Transcript_3917/g.7508 Transcript_3917/m.7508 type:complete len:274 (-) Transcript_3917:358-1179(-)
MVEANADVRVANRRHRPVARAAQSNSGAHFHVWHALKIKGVQEVEQVHAKVLQVAVEHEVGEQAPELALLHTGRVKREETVQPEELREILAKEARDAECDKRCDSSAAIHNLVDGVRKVHERPQQWQHPEHGLLTAVHAHAAALSNGRARPAFRSVLGLHDALGVLGALAFARPLRRATPDLRRAEGPISRHRDAGRRALLLTGPALNAVTGHQRLLSPLELWLSRRGTRAGLGRAGANVCGANRCIALADLDAHRHWISEERRGAVHLAVHN